jgi:hypothetical protein
LDGAARHPRALTSGLPVSSSPRKPVRR